jgi:predicted molibdopterin-dependent oxidoreductase YjgC
VTADAVRRAARLLACQQMAIFAGRSVTQHPEAAGVLTALGNLAVLTGNAANMNVPVTENNQQGAMDMGILPDVLPGYVPTETPGMNTGQMLKAASTGALKMLWIVNVDLANAFHDRGLAIRALENCPFVVVHAHTLTETASMANVVLPVQTVAERDGTFTNCERRVQRFYKAFEISPEIHSDWVIFAQIAAQMGSGLPYFSPRDILREITATVPIYKDCGPRALGEEGVRWQYPEAERPPADVEAVEYRLPAVR